MKNTQLQRDYIMNNAELYMFVSNLCSTMKRDLDDFAEFSITIDKINQLYAQAREFSKIPTDIEALGDIMVAVENKNIIRESVIDVIRMMVIRVQFRWTSDSTKVSRLGVGSMMNLPDTDLLQLARNVHTKMLEYLPDLSGQGLTQAMLDNLNILNNNFELAINEKDDAKTARQDLTAERISKGNALYRLTASYCDLGKRLYAKTNPAKYDDYLLYPGTRSPMPKIPVNIIYDAVNSVIRWDETPNATSYQVVARLNNDKSKWKSIYKGIKNFAEFKPAPGEWLLKIRARNAGGYGKWSEEFTIKKL